MRSLPLLGVLLATSVASAESTGVVETQPVIKREPLPIIGGTKATVGQFPTVVALTVGGGICTGTLVDKDWILTAAHCVNPGVLGLSSQQAVTDSVRVYFNSVDINTPAGRTNVRRASMTIPKPSFNINALGSNDVGMIKLATPITEIPPTPINFDAAMAPVGITVTMVGFGATAVSGGGTVGVEYVLQNKISTSCSGFGGSNTNLLCFNQTDTKGKCSGDSGGPSFAMINGKQMVVGITSFGDQDCAQFGADTRTDIEKDFMLMYAPQLEAKCTLDSECPNAGVCFQGKCLAQPLVGNGLGAECTASTGCESNLCAAGPGGMKCTMTCTIDDDSTCPANFECVDAGGTGACWASEFIVDDGGGCCDASGKSAPTALFGFGFVALLLRRRRR